MLKKICYLKNTYAYSDQSIHNHTQRVKIGLQRVKNIKLTETTGNAITISNKGMLKVKILDIL